MTLALNSVHETGERPPSEVNAHIRILHVIDTVAVGGLQNGVSKRCRWAGS